MKFSTGVAIAVFAVVALAAAQPTPPTLAPSYTANFTVTSPKYWKTGAPAFHGGFGIDDSTGAGYLDFAGEEYIPLILASNVIAHPHTKNITGYFYAGEVCWYDTIPKTFLKLFPFEIPPSSKFVGYQLINNFNCSGWEFDFNDDTIVLWASNSTDGGNSTIVRIVDPDVLFVDQVIINFVNVVEGPPPAWSYAPPSFSHTGVCIPPPFFDDDRAGVAQGIFETGGVWKLLESTLIAVAEISGFLNE